MGADPTEWDLVALGLGLGGLAAFAQRPITRVRARLSTIGRTALAWATYPAGALVLVLTLLVAAAIGPLAAWSFLVGLLGARTLLIGDVEA